MFKPRDHSAPLFDRLKLLIFSDIYVYKITLFMFKLMNGSGTDVVSDLFCKNSAVHNYITRQSAQLHEQNVELNVKRKGL